jgi:hypothetical protein
LIFLWRKWNVIIKICISRSYLIVLRATIIDVLIYPIYTNRSSAVKVKATISCRYRVMVFSCWSLVLLLYVGLIWGIDWRKNRSLFFIGHEKLESFKMLFPINFMVLESSTECFQTNFKSQNCLSLLLLITTSRETTSSIWRLSI